MIKEEEITRVEEKKGRKFTYICAHCGKVVYEDEYWGDVKDMYLPHREVSHIKREYVFRLSNTLADEYRFSDVLCNDCNSKFRAKLIAFAEGAGFKRTGITSGKEME